MSLRDALALVASVSARSRSITLPWRTSPTEPKPNPFRAWPMAFPWGSRTPFFNVTKTRAFMLPSYSEAIGHKSFDQHRPFVFALHRFRHDAEAPRDFAVSFDHAAQITAETVLVQLLVCLQIPETAAVGADLVGQHDAHIVVFPQPPEFQLEIDQLDARAQEQAGQKVVDADGEVDDVVQILRA